MVWPFSRRRRRLRDVEVTALLRSAVLALARRDTEKAEEALSKLLQDDSEQSDTYLALGILYRERGEIGRAIRLHQNLLLRKDLAPTLRQSAQAELARDLQAGGFTRRAIAAYRELLELAPRDASALAALRDLLAAEGDLGDALDWHRRLEKAQRARDPQTTARLLVAEARALHDVGDSRQAARTLRRAIRMDPDEVDGRLLLADIHIERGRDRAAQKIWRELVEAGGAGADVAYRRLSAAGSRSGGQKRHERFLAARVNAAPGDRRARRELARQQLASGDTEEAIAQWRALLDLDPQDIPARIELGHALLAERHDADALKAYGELLAVLEGIEKPPGEPTS